MTATVYDEIGNTVEAARIQVLKYDVYTNNYVQVEQAETNWEGQAILHLLLNQEYYKFNVLYNDDLKLATNPSYIYSNSLVFRINLEDLILEDFYNSARIIYSFVYNDATNNFRLEYIDPDGLDVQACIYVEKLYGNYTQDLGSSCSTGASGTVLFGITSENETIFSATAKITIDNEEGLLATLTKQFGSEDKLGMLGLFVTILFAISFGFGGMLFGKPSIALVMMPLPFLITSIVGIIPMSWGIWVAIELFFIIIAYVVSEKG